VATANKMQPIPPPLLDRMEVIELPGYTPEEKLRIAMQYLIPRVLDQHGLSSEFLQIPEVEDLLGLFLSFINFMLKDIIALHNCRIMLACEMQFSVSYSHRSQPLSISYRSERLLAEGHLWK